MDNTTRIPRTVRLSASEVGELKAAARGLGMGWSWSEFLRRVGLAVARRHNTNPATLELESGVVVGLAEPSEEWHGNCN